MIVSIQDACARQAKLTFAMARHTVVDVTQVLGRAPIISVSGRYSNAPAMEFLSTVENVQSLTFNLGLVLF